MKPINIIIIVVTALLLLGTFLGGYMVGRNSVKCPTITTDTIPTYDTIDHHIYHIWPWYIQAKDSVIYYPVYQDVDTAEILKDYFAKHIYDRQWENDTIKVNISDTITRNTPIGNGFTYKIKTPFSTINNSIDNSVTYNRYISLGLDVPIKNVKYLELEAIYHTEKFYTGLGYEPEINSFNVKLGMTILKLKKKR